MSSISMFDEEYRQATVLIVDDEPANVRLLERILEKDGYAHVQSATDPRHFLALYKAKKPDVVLLDLHMPNMDGFQVLEQLKGRSGVADFVPILVLTADITPQAKQRALSMGAKDFLTKPVDPAEVLLRIRNLLETRYFYRQLQDQNEQLDRKVRERTHALEQAQVEILERLARAAEYRDDNTGHHAQRVGHVSALIAFELGLPDEQVYLIRRAAPLHDVGKIGIPDSILLKPARLTEQEFNEMKKHTSIGAGILSGSSFSVLQTAEEIAMYHHEAWDGSGYIGLEEETIPISARIVHAADVLDALTHERPYKEAWPLDLALAELRQGSETAFDPHVIGAVFKLKERNLLEVKGAPPPPSELFRIARAELAPAQGT